MTKIALIVAVSQNGAIGKDNDLLWHIPEDMKHFKKTTSGHTIITGRRNYDSIPEKYRPLPNRENIVITKNKSLNYGDHESLHIVDSLESAIELSKKLDKLGEVFVIGGGQIYRQCLEAKIIDNLYITYVHSDFEGDTFFEIGKYSNWTKVQEEFYPVTKSRELAFSICKYQKIE